MQNYWTFWIFILLPVTFIIGEIYALKTGRQTLSRYVWELSKRFLPISLPDSWRDFYVPTFGGEGKQCALIHDQEKMHYLQQSEKAGRTHHQDRRVRRHT